jgi:hypothetical protein
MLSAKQQRNLELKWELEAQDSKIMVAMADAVRGLVEQSRALRAEIDALEEQVPDSVEAAWEDADGEHLRLRNQADREEWLAAYALVKKASGV